MRESRNQRSGVGEMADDGGEILRGTASLAEAAVDFFGMAAERRRRTRFRRRLLRQRQVLEHQGGGEAGLVVVVGRRFRPDTRHRAIGRERPALAGSGGSHFIKRLGVEAELFGQHESFRHRDHRNAEDHVVADLGGLPGPRLTAMDDALAHGAEDGLGCARKPACSPPAMKVSVAAAAPAVPPETGASRLCM